MDVMAVVERHLGGPFGWGVADCCAAASAAFAEIHGIDLMPDLRGTYAGPIAAARIIRQAGGLRRLAETRAAAAGLRRCGDVPGAIGLVAGPRGPVAAICIAPGKWAAKARQGFVIVREAEIAWSV